MMDRLRLHLRVTGVVQGVGFRPFVYQLANRCGLSGHVGNDSNGVFIEIEGMAAAIARFRAALTEDAPPLAHIDSVTETAIAPLYDSGFFIVESVAQRSVSTLVSPDLCTCDDCLRELLDPTDRRYRYPFINCTNCGPRFTIIRGLPYDRPQTTMDGFMMCDACAAEYHDPTNRRFHAQPNACPDCGPRLWFTGASSAADPIRAAQAALYAGQIVAVKGLGGFHLACAATNVDAITRLRARKRREAKPLAVMVADLEAARRIAIIGEDEAVLLVARERPILLLRKREAAPLVTGANNPMIGVMLPYTPLHILLLTGMDVPLVMTSGNYSGEPIITDNETALDKLAGVADAFLLHDRDIHTACDDSVVRVFAGYELPLRRSRGYAPFPVALPFAVPPLLAVGGELKASFCMTRERHAFMSQHIGDMENLETLNAFQHAFEHMRGLFRIEPEAIACDQHPGYLSTRWAGDFARRHDLPLIPVQHHHAHIAAVMAEHGLDHGARVIGFSMDGTGYGTDGAVWGGEVLIAAYSGFERAAHLRYTPLPGGDLSIRRTYRMALAHLWAAGIPWDEDLPCVAACPPQERRILRQQFERGVGIVPTSSMGRLFDAVASLVGVRHIALYEAQAAIELEGIAAIRSEAPYAFALDGDVFDPKPLLKAIIADLRDGVAPAVISSRFHSALANLLLMIAEVQRSQHQLHIVALSGGVFQNVVLLHMVRTRLEAAGFTVLHHQRVPTNDAGIALGQAMVAAYRSSSSMTIR